jgi:hypothetical protein
MHKRVKGAEGVAFPDLSRLARKIRRLRYVRRFTEKVTSDPYAALPSRAKSKIAEGRSRPSVRLPRHRRRRWGGRATRHHTDR